MSKQLSAVLRLSHTTPEGARHLAYFCPGCGYAHIIPVGPQGATPEARWTYDGNDAAPSFSPSIHVGPGTVQGCHHFVNGGRIQFLTDCWHPLAGQTVPLPEWPGDEPALLP